MIDDDGEDPNLKDTDGNTPLHHHAANDSAPEVVIALLNRNGGGEAIKADPNIQNKRSQTALHLAKT